jgi:hypothetical protein
VPPVPGLAGRGYPASGRAARLNGGLRVDRGPLESGVEPFRHGAFLQRAAAESRGACQKRITALQAPNDSSTAMTPPGEITYSARIAAIGCTRVARRAAGKPASKANTIATDAAAA